MQDLKRIRNIVAHHDKIMDRYCFKESAGKHFSKHYYKNNADMVRLLNEENLCFKQIFFKNFLEISKDANYNQLLSLQDYDFYRRFFLRLFDDFLCTNMIVYINKKLFTLCAFVVGLWEQS